MQFRHSTVEYFPSSHYIAWLLYLLSSLVRYRPLLWMHAISRRSLQRLLRTTKC